MNCACLRTTSHWKRLRGTDNSQEKLCSASGKRCKGKPVCFLVERRLSHLQTFFVSSTVIACHLHAVETHYDEGKTTTLELKEEERERDSKKTFLDAFSPC